MNLNRLKINSVFALFSLLILLSSCTKKESWSKFLGTSNMIVTGDEYPLEWNDSTNIKWTYEMVGESWSSPVIWGERIFITSAYTDYVEETPQAAPVQQGGQNPPPGN